MIQIVLPLPDKRLHQNARVHWSKRSKATKAYRLYSANVLRKCRQWDRKKWPCCRANVVFIFPDSKRRDVSNYLAAMKAVWDGFEDAGLYEDDRAVWFGNVYAVVVKGVAEVRVSLALAYPPRLEI